MRLFQRGAWLAVVGLVAGYLVVAQIREGYTFEVAPLTRELESIPLELNDWHGTETPLADDGTRELLNAQAMINRIYQKGDGSAVALNISAWLRPETVTAAAPHIPKICYVNSGWTILEEREIVLPTQTGDLPLVTLLLERNDQRIIVAYWYQMGPSYFTSVEEARRIHRSLWGQPRWPATFKILFQTPARTIETGMPTIEYFAAWLQREMSEVAGNPQA